MDILLTNIVLAGRSGTEIFVQQLADALRQRGHRPLLYSPHVGALGESMRRRGHLVYDRIADVAIRPDVIHGHHCGPTMTALAAFPETPGIFVSHSVEAEFDRPPIHPNILRYFAVSNLIPHRWNRPELPRERFQILPNCVDTDRYPLLDPAPAKPRSALIVTKYGTHLEQIERACQAHGIAVTRAGAGVGNTSSNLPALFADSDLVFTSGRTALEAMASGRPVILTEGGRFHGMITSADIEKLIAGNLGVAVLTRESSESALLKAIEAYDHEDARRVSQYVRTHLSLAGQVDFLSRVYQGLAGADLAGNNRDRPVANFLEGYVPGFHQGHWSPLSRYVAGPAWAGHAGDPGWFASARSDPENHLAEAFYDMQGPATVADIAHCFRLLLGRSPGAEEWVEHCGNSGKDLSQVVGFFVNSEEFQSRWGWSTQPNPR